MQMTALFIFAHLPKPIIPMNAKKQQEEGDDSEAQQRSVEGSS